MGKKKSVKSMAARIDEAFYGRAEKNSALIGAYLKKRKRVK